MSIRLSKTDNPSYYTEDAKRLHPQYNRRVRRYEKYFSVSYHDAYIELVKYKLDIKRDYNELLKVLSLEQIKNEKVNNALVKIKRDIDIFDSVTSRVEYYTENSKKVFLELFGKVDLEKVYKNYGGIFKLDKKDAYKDIRNIISTEYDKLLENDENFRATVIAILLSIKGPAFYYPYFNYANSHLRLTNYENYDEVKDLYKGLEEERKREE